ncbi:conserved hypothetical protein, partial [Ricinus communis]
MSILGHIQHRQQLLATLKRRTDLAQALGNKYWRTTQGLFDTALACLGIALQHEVSLEVITLGRRCQGMYLEARLAGMAQAPHAGTPVKSEQKTRLPGFIPIATHLKVTGHPAVRARAVQIEVCMVNQMHQAALLKPDLTIRSQTLGPGLDPVRLTGLAIEPGPACDALEQAKAHTPRQYRCQPRQQYQFQQCTHFAARTRFCALQLTAVP